MRSAALALLSTLILAGCGGDEPAQILIRWRHTSERALTPPAIGPERRVIVSQKETPAQLVTLQEENGGALEGPYDLFPSMHAPLAVGTDIYLVSSIGRIVHTDLAGQTLPAPSDMLGLTSPLAVASNGTLRVASTAGRLISFDAQGQIGLDVTFTGATDTAPAVAEDGTTYVATDIGSLVGFSTAGSMVMNVTVDAPASGPSTAGGVVAVGHGTGVAAYQADGTLIFDRDRAARVTGTRVLDNGEILAWGEDGALELLDANGGVIMSYVAGPPIYTPAVVVDDAFAIVDDMGTAHLVDRDGTARTTLSVGGKPERQIASGAWVYVTVGNEVLALDFTSRSGE